MDTVVSRQFHIQGSRWCHVVIDGGRNNRRVVELSESRKYLEQQFLLVMRHHDVRVVNDDHLGLSEHGQGHGCDGTFNGFKLLEFARAIDTKPDNLFDLTHPAFSLLEVNGIKVTSLSDRFIESQTIFRHNVVTDSSYRGSLDSSVGLCHGVDTVDNEGSPRSTEPSAQC